jgi:hypothetical protein
MANDFTLQMFGEMGGEPAAFSPSPGRPFLLKGHFQLPVGWRVIEVFPRYPIELWRPDLAPTWAELDLLGVAATRNLLDQQLQQIDPNAAARKRMAELLREGEELLEGLEAPVQAFLQRHPELLVPAYKQVWPKLPLGKRVTDFVLQEQSGDYLVVEIEAPTRTLFRKDGQPHEDLVHAQNQVVDWWRYIEDNLSTVRHELGLTGVSAKPQALIVIGRSASLSPEDRRKLYLLNDSNPKMRVITYDDLFANAAAVASNLLGPLWMIQGDAQVYYLPAPQ